MCRNLYKEAGITSREYLRLRVNSQYIKRALAETKPDILVVTGHDSLKKGSDPNLLDSYRNSKYFIECVKEARNISLITINCAYLPVRANHILRPSCRPEPISQAHPGE